MLNPWSQRRTHNYPITAERSRTANPPHEVGLDQIEGEFLQARSLLARSGPGDPQRQHLAAVEMHRRHEEKQKNLENHDHAPAASEFPPWKALNGHEGDAGEEHQQDGAVGQRGELSGNLPHHPSGIVTQSLPGGRDGH